MTEPLVDVHAHFLHEGCGRSDWRDVNAARLRAGERIGITCHVASILGTFGFRSPTYFPSPDDVTVGNDAMFGLCRKHGALIRMLVTVNPNFPAHARMEIERGVQRGAVGVKLAASRRADDPLLDDVCELAAKYRLPILHHIWQHRRREWPNQEASDGADLAHLAGRHPRVTFVLAYIGGGGDYLHSFAAIRDVPNIVADTSGSGVDRGMLDAAVVALGSRRLVWGSDITMETGLAKLRALEHTGLSSAEEIRDIRWRNATRVFGESVTPNGQRAKRQAGSPKARARAHRA